MADSPLKLRVSEDMKSALRAGEKQRLGIIRLILAAIKQREVDDRIALDDGQVLAVLEKMLKQRRESVSQYEAAGRQDLADQEHFEIGVVQGYMPAPLGEAEIDALIAAAIAETGAQTGKDMGKVISALRLKVQGRADMGKLSAKVKTKLGG
ncbi:MAG: GatB/YqeY domain-containing protein [Gammaproteobacteria bacterium]|nr:GatB/YqeY domain-containing protein [Gammaproteobacteria bacterium]